MSLVLRKTRYGDLERITQRYYKDIDSLNSLIRVTKNKSTKQKYIQEIERIEKGIRKYEEDMGMIYKIWSEMINVIWDFGAFWILIETGERRRIFS